MSQISSRAEALRLQRSKQDIDLAVKLYKHLYDVGAQDMLHVLTHVAAYYRVDVDELERLCK